MKLIQYMTKKSLIPKFRHFFVYDNAPSHMKRADDAPFLKHICKSDGHGTVARRSTMWDGEVQSLVNNENENKGVQTIGYERGHWGADGKRPPSADGTRPADTKPLTLEAMREILARDPDFAYCPSILEDTVKEFNTNSTVEFDVFYLAKFWCPLAFIEQFWCDVKRLTRELCDGTITGLKRTFPIALHTACPRDRLRKYNQRSLDRILVLLEGGREMDFSQFPGLVKTWKYHRESELMARGLTEETTVRKRSEWGSVQHAKRIRH